MAVPVRDVSSCASHIDVNVGPPATQCEVPGKGWTGGVKTCMLSPEYPVDVHHTIPKRIQKALGFGEDALDDCPGYIITKERHTWADDAIHNRINSMDGLAGNNLELERVIEKLPQVYREANMPDVAEVVRKWLVAKRGL